MTVEGPEQTGCSRSACFPKCPLRRKLTSRIFGCVRQFHFEPVSRPLALSLPNGHRALSSTAELLPVPAEGSWPVGVDCRHPVQPFNCRRCCASTWHGQLIVSASQQGAVNPSLTCPQPVRRLDAALGDARRLHDEAAPRRPEREIAHGVCAPATGTNTVQAQTNFPCRVAWFLRRCGDDRGQPFALNKPITSAMS